MTKSNFANYDSSEWDNNKIGPSKFIWRGANKVNFFGLGAHSLNLHKEFLIIVVRCGTPRALHPKQWIMGHRNDICRCSWCGSEHVRSQRSSAEMTWRALQVSFFRYKIQFYHFCIQLFVLAGGYTAMFTSASSVCTFNLTHFFHICRRLHRTGEYPHVKPFRRFTNASQSISCIVECPTHIVHVEMH